MRFQASINGRRCVAWVVLACISLVFAAAAQDVTLIVSSKKGDRLTSKPPVHFKTGAKAKTSTFQIDDGTTYQTMAGFGASILEAGLMCINTLPPEQQEAVLKACFDPKDGAGFTAMKTPLAGTDFQSAGPWYTYDDTPGDVELKHFSIERDLGPNGLVTYIKRARKYGNFVLEAPIDYPPDWMLVDVNKKQDVDPKYYDALAHYFLRYLQEYEKQGIVIDYLGMFNEPGVYTKIKYDEIHTLLRDHVIPLLAKEHVKTKLMLSESVERKKALRDYPAVLDDPDVRKSIAAMPYHGYDWGHFDAIANLHAKYPDLPLFMTELCHAYEAGTPPKMKLPRFDFEDGDFWGNTIFSDLEASASMWIYWNMVLDEKGGPWAISPIHGNPDPNIQHPVVIINKDTKEVTYTGLYYYLAHFSKFVRPGAVRIASSGTVKGVRCMAFKSGDKGYVIELMNSGQKAVKVNVAFHGSTFAVSLPPVSISTCMWKS